MEDNAINVPNCGNRLPEWNIDVSEPRYDALGWPLLDGVRVNKRIVCGDHLRAT